LYLKEMFRLHKYHKSRAGPRPPVLERPAEIQKALEKAPTKKKHEEVERMGDALEHHRKKDVVSIK
jgi:hypothetical protein